MWNLEKESKAWCHCAAVYPIHINFLQNFDGLARPLFKFVSIFCQISSLQLHWKKWNFCGATGSRSLGGLGINFPIGAREGGSCFKPRRSSSLLFPITSQCIVAVLELWCVFWDKSHWLRPPSSPPLLPRLQEAEQSKSLTADKTLVLGTFTMPSFNYQMLKYQNIILDRELSIFGIKNYLQPDTRDKYCVKSSFQNQSSWYIGVDSVGGDILGAMSCHSGAVTVLVGWAMVSRLLHLSRISRR